MNDVIDVIIPARNEQDNILSLVREFEWHPAIGTVIVGIDADTTDNTVGVLFSTTATLLFGARGKGQVVSRCLQIATSPYVLFCDADVKGLTQVHIDLLIANAIFDDAGEHPVVTIGVPDVPENYPTDRLWAWPWVSGQRCVPRRLVNMLNLHGYLMEAQINAATKHAAMPINFEWLTGLKSEYKMTDKRLAEMQRDADYGRRHGIL